ncbi:MAG: hypothetical protein ABSD75_13830 [Terriglobales bacterium]
MHYSTCSDSGNATREGASPAPLFPVEHILPCVLVIALFLLWGMSNNLTDMLVQKFK